MLVATTFLIGLAALIIAIVALVGASGAKRRALALERELAALRKAVEAVEIQGSTAPPEPLAAALQTPGAVIEPIASDVEARARPVDAAAAAAPPAPEAHVARVADSDRVERALGLVWATRIGSALLLLGALFFFKVAVERNWLGPWARVALGFGAGLLCIGIAALVRRRANERWVGALVGLGLAIMLAALWVAHALYHLLPGWAALVALATFAVGAGLLAITWRLEAVLVSAATAGFIDLVALSGSLPGHATFMLFGVVLAVAVLAVAVPRRWDLAALTVPLGFLPGLATRHFGMPELLGSAFGPPLPAPGGLDTIAAFALAALLATLFVIVALRRAEARGTAAIFAWAAVALVLGLAVLLLATDLSVLAFAAPAVALAVAVQRALLDAAGRPTLDALSLASAVLGSLILVGCVVADPRSSAFLVPSLVFVLASLAGAAFTRQRAAAAAELGVVAGGVVLWVSLHRDKGAGDAATVLAFATAAALVLWLVIDVLRAATAPVAVHAERLRDPARRAAVIAATVLVALGLLRAQLPAPWTTVAIALVALPLAALVRRGGAWVGWLVASVLLVAMFTFLAIDLAIVDAVRAELFASGGARGAYLPEPFVGVRALPLLAIGLAALATRALAGRHVDRSEGYGTLEGVLRVFGHLFIFAFVLDQAFIVAVGGAFDTARILAIGERDATRVVIDELAGGWVILTVVAAVQGALVLAWGFFARSRLDRWVGLVIVGLALAKLLTFDLTVMDGVARTLVLACFGVLLLASGFLYARFAPGVRSIFAGDADGPGERQRHDE